MEVYTIGFTQRSAEDFFGTLKKAGIRRLVDVRLNNSSQLAAFAKRRDLAYFLRELCGAEYVHKPILAPTQEILDALKKHKGSWFDYEQDFLRLMKEREIEKAIDRDLFSIPSTLLCSERTAHHCHRRLVLEYLQEHWTDIDLQVVHM